MQRYISLGFGDPKWYLWHGFFYLTIFFFFQILDLTIANASIQTQINQTFPFQMLQMLLFEMSLFQMSKLCKCSKQTGEAQTLLGTEASFLYVQSLVEVTKLQMKTILD